MAISLRGLQPEVRRRADWALAVAKYYSIPVTVTSAYRSWNVQARLRRNYEQCVAEGRFPSAPDCKYPANRPGDSSHNWGLAWDSTTEPRYQPAWNAIRQWAGFEVLPNDQIHAQVPNWRRLVSGVPR